MVLQHSFRLYVQILFKYVQNQLKIEKIAETPPVIYVLLLDIKKQ